MTAPPAGGAPVGEVTTQSEDPLLQNNYVKGGGRGKKKGKKKKKPVARPSSLIHRAMGAY